MKIAVVSGVDHAEEARALFEWLREEAAEYGATVVMCSEFSAPEADTTHICITCCSGCAEAQRQHICNSLRVYCPLIRCVSQIRLDQFEDYVDAIMDELRLSKPVSTHTLEVAVA